MEGLIPGPEPPPAVAKTNSTTAPTKTPPYSYIQFIKAPSELGMSDAGNMDAIENNLNGLISYVDLLIDGPSKASKAENNGALGDRRFIETTAKCNVMGVPVTRSIYVDNVPKGGIGAAPGANIPDFKGLIPGMMSGLDSLDPERMAKSIGNTDNPECISVTLNVMDEKYNTVPATNYITLVDAEYIDPCSFTSGVNPATNGTCIGKVPPTVQAFTTRSDLIFSEISNDYVSQIFITSVGIMVIFILHLLLKNRFKFK